MSKKLYVVVAREFSNTEWKGSRKGRGLVKIGETTREKVRKRIKEQAAQLPMELDLRAEFTAITKSGLFFNDKIVHKYLEHGLGISRIKGVEWFECSIEEVCNAVKDIIEEKVSIEDIRKMGRKSTYLPASKKPWKSSEKDYINEEKKKINALEVVRAIRKGYINNREIAVELYKQLQIKYIAPRTMEPLIVDIMKKLKSLAIVENKGEYFSPELKITEHAYTDEQLAEISSNGGTGRSVSIEEILSYLTSSQFGGTPEEMANFFNSSTSGLSGAIKKLYENNKIIRVNITKRDGFNGIRVRYFLQGSSISLPNGEYFKITKKETELGKAREMLHKLKLGYYIETKEIIETFGMKKASTFISRYSSDNEVKEISLNGTNYLVSADTYNSLGIFKIPSYILKYLSKETIKELKDFDKIEENIVKIVSVSKLPINIQRVINLLKTFYQTDNYNALYEYVKALVANNKILMNKAGYLSIPEKRVKTKDTIINMHNLSLNKQFLNVLLERIQNNPVSVMDISRETGVRRDKVIKELAEDGRFFIQLRNNRYFVYDKPGV